MATFAARVTFANDNALAPRMQVALVLTALTVAAEVRPAADASQEVRTRSNVRRSFAKDVLKDSVSAVPRLRWVLACTDLADVVAPTDDDILTRVASLWDAISGA